MVAGGCVEVVSRAVVVVFSDCILPTVAVRTQQFAAGLMILKVRTLRASEGLPWSGILCLWLRVSVSGHNQPVWHWGCRFVLQISPVLSLGFELGVPIGLSTALSATGS